MVRQVSTGDSVVQRRPPLNILQVEVGLHLPIYFLGEQNVNDRPVVSGNGQVERARPLNGNLRRTHQQTREPLVGHEFGHACVPVRGRVQEGGLERVDELFRPRDPWYLREAVRHFCDRHERISCWHAQQQRSNGPPHHDVLLSVLQSDAAVSCAGVESPGF